MGRVCARMTEILYIFIVIAALALGKLAEKNKNVWLVWLLIVFLTIFCGMRGVSVGIDTPSYYENIIAGFPYPWKFREEGFRLLSTVVMQYTNNVQLVFILCAFVTNTLIILRLWEFKKEGKFSFMIMLYLLVFFENDLNIMRQMVSISLIFWGTRYLKDKGYISYLVFLFIAFTFHRSAILAIGFLLWTVWGNLSRKQKKIAALPFLMVIILAASYAYASLLADIDSYSAQNVSNVNITYIYRVSIAVLAIILEKFKIRIKLIKASNKVIDRNYHFQESVPFYYLVGLGFAGLSMFFAFAGRTGLYYLVFEMIFWGVLVKQSVNRGLYKILIGIYALYVFALFLLTNSVNAFPYYIYIY